MIRTSQRGRLRSRQRRDQPSVRSHLRVTLAIVLVSLSGFLLVAMGVVSEQRFVSVTGAAVVPTMLAPSQEPSTTLSVNAENFAVRANGRESLLCDTKRPQDQYVVSVAGVQFMSKQKISAFSRFFEDVDLQSVDPALCVVQMNAVGTATCSRNAFNPVRPLIEENLCFTSYSLNDYVLACLFFTLENPSPVLDANQETLLCGAFILPSGDVP